MSGGGKRLEKTYQLPSPIFQTNNGGYWRDGYRIPSEDRVWEKKCSMCIRCMYRQKRKNTFDTYTIAIVDILYIYLSIHRDVWFSAISYQHKRNTGGVGARRKKMENKRPRFFCIRCAPGIYLVSKVRFLEVSLAFGVMSGTNR